MIKTLWRLSDFAVTKNRSALPGLSMKGILLTVIYAALLLAGSLFWLRDLQDPRVLFVGAAGFISAAGLYVMIGEVVTLASSSSRYWYLSLPYSRMDLACAKVLAYMRVLARIAVPVVLAIAAHYIWVCYYGDLTPLSRGELIGMAAASVLTVVAAAPLTLSFGLLSATLYSGWVRWLYIVPYILIVEAPFVLFNLVVIMDSTMYTPANMLLVAGILLVIGWPISYGLIKYSAVKGLPALAAVKSGGSGLTRQSNRTARATPKARAAGNRNRFAALYQLERTFYSALAQKWTARMIVLTLCAVTGVIAYFAADDSGSLADLANYLMPILLFVPILYSINLYTTDSQQRRVQWWLSFPNSRRQLVLARLLALWAAVMKGMAGIGIAYWIGVGIAVVLKRVDASSLLPSLQWFLYAALLFMVVLTVSLLVSQVFVPMAKSKKLSLLYIPIFLVYIYQPLLLMNLFFQENPAGGPRWMMILLYLAIGLPVGVISFLYGAKQLNQLAIAEPRRGWMKTE